MFSNVEFQTESDLHLRDLVSRANRRFTADRIVAQMDYIVKQRTAKGSFLEGSSPDAGRYRSSRHKKLREQKGRQIAHVDLFFGGTGGRPSMLSDTKHRTTVSEENIALDYGYLTGLSTEENITIASYHNIDGAGRSRVKRIFVGFAKDEQDKLVSSFARDYGSALTDALGES